MACPSPSTSSSSVPSSLITTQLADPTAPCWTSDRLLHSKSTPRLSPHGKRSPNLASRVVYRVLALFGRSQDLNKPNYNHHEYGSACRIYGSFSVKRITANFHVTSLGHDYISRIHVDHNRRHFPGIIQPLNNSFEVTHNKFIAYQYYLCVVSTTYAAPRTQLSHTNCEYSVTHCERQLKPHLGVPGISFKFDDGPVRLTLIQRSHAQFFIRCVGVIGGIFVCVSWGLRATDRVISVVAGPDDTGSTAPPDSARSSGLRSKWTGEALRARSSNASLQRGVWAEAGSPYGSPMLPYWPYLPASAPPPLSGRTPSGDIGSFSGTPAGLGVSPGLFAPGSTVRVGGMRTPAMAAMMGSLAPGLGTPAFGNFPPTPDRR
ncbi:Endoplasmic reticulum vesicle transporter domain containing protein [Lactarius tabidus]